MKKRISIDLDDEKYEKLAKIAEANHRKIKNQAERLLSLFVEQEEDKRKYE
tara:strand:+ start:512 stop:664 length:153 start_codon:yes stop_codon:yes gene_type:complete